MAETQAEGSKDKELQKPELPTDLLHLSDGKGYKVESSDIVTRRSLTNVVLLAGTAKSGKTTLLASVMLLFQKGNFAGYGFAGSQTLVGFEERVHRARVTSNLDQPDFERTKFSELLHLRVRRIGDSAVPRDLLLCDLWGEDFREAKDSVEGCKRISVIRRADCFALLIDGGKLCNEDSRQQAKNEPISLLRNILDCEMLTETSDVDVVHTKWDKVQNSPDRIDAEAFASHVDQEIERRFASRVGSIAYWRVAAHATDGSMALGYGLEPLFKKWADRQVGMPKHRYRPPSESSISMEFDRFQSREEKGRVT